MPSVLSQRDRDYIEARLYDPAPHLMEAIGRLEQNNMYPTAARLRTALRALHDIVGETRRDLRANGWSEKP